MQRALSILKTSYGSSDWLTGAGAVENAQALRKDPAPFKTDTLRPPSLCSSEMASGSSSEGPTTPFSPPDVHPYSHKVQKSASAMRDAASNGADCPVCLEPLSMRLAGEKPHVLPVCGHKLHEACFEAVYGPIAQIKARAKIGLRGQSIGLCGVCRRDMKLGDATDAGNRKDKFAAISGLQPEVNEFKVRSISKRTHPATDIPVALHNPAEDDEIIALHPAGRTSHDTLKRNPIVPVAQPLIKVHSETPSIMRPADRSGRTRVTALVTVEMPSRLPRDALDQAKREATRSPPIGEAAPSVSSSNEQDNKSATSSYSPDVTQAFPPGVTRPLSPIVEQHPALKKALQDLKLRMNDWKGHEPDQFGSLTLFDTLQVAKEDTSREFAVYLFEEALLCVADDKKKGIAGRLADGISMSGSDRLRLKGRVFVRHIRQIEIREELALSITMGDDALEGFVLTFPDIGKLQTWQMQLEALLAKSNQPPPLPSVPPPPPPSADLRSRSVHSGARASVISTEPSTHSSRSSSDHYSRYTPATTVSYKDLQADGHSSGMSDPSLLTTPLGYQALDLVLVLSVPSQTNAPSAAPLKSRLLRNTVEFLTSSGAIGPAARVAIIAYSAGDGLRGVLRKTPLLSVERSPRRLATVVSELAAEVPMGEEKELRLVNHNDDRVTVVTAVNLALDIILQRNQKAPLTGIVLVNDGRDGAPKQQMDLVMARMDHAGVPLHAFGWGKAHDPSSLWLLSNHSGGTYTFVREWYGLRDALAGCIGGMLSIAATSFKLHISVPEKRWFSIRKVAGVQTAIVSSNGKDADIDLGEIRSGERREMLVEVEMSALSTEAELDTGKKRQTANITATDEYFMKNAGLDPLSLEDDNLYEDEYESLMDDIPLFEVNASFRDPAAGKFVARLPMPVLLTVTITPPTGQSAAPKPLPDVVVVRRRIELLCSDMMTRCLLLMSRRNPGQALRLLTETRRIVQTILTSLSEASSGSSRRSFSVSQSDEDSRDIFLACIDDIDFLHDGVRMAAEATTSESHAFETNHRNFAAQQAVVLRDQRAWTERSRTEKAYFNADLARLLAQRSRNYLAA